MALDRVAPTRRPDRPALGLQSWRHLLFVHWEVPVEVLRPLVPARLAIDTYDGRAYVGLIPFRMEKVRPLKVLPAVPGAARFCEFNLRTYVHRDGRDPGIWFFSLDAASTPAVLAARAAFHLPYFRARMEVAVADGAASYRSVRLWPGPRPAACDAACTVGAPLPPAAPDSLRFWLAERYLLYAARKGKLWRGQVHHAPYPLHAAEVVRLEESLCAAAGIARPPGPGSVPALYSPGVDVEIFPLERV